MKKKKLLSMLILCSMILALISPPVASYGASFSDTRGHWAESYIEQAVAHGFVRGYADGTFLPDNPVTRAEFTAMVNRALGNNATANVTFTDVPHYEWFFDDVSRAFAAAYVGGYEDNTFRPNNTITRQEAAVMISRIIPAYNVSGNLNVFPDRASIADWAFAAFQKVVGKGYIGGFDDGNLYPLQNLTRAQTAKIICDILDNETIVRNDRVVTSNREVLSNTIFANGVTIHRDLGDGSATIENSIILGPLRVQGGAEVTVSNSRVAQATVERTTGSVRLLVRGESVVASLGASGNATIQTSNLSGGLFGSGVNQLRTWANSDITLQGNFPRVNVDGADAKLTVESGTVTNLVVSSNARRSEITVASGATVSTAEVNADSHFYGQGIVTTMVANANGITYERRPGTINTAPGVNAPTQANPASAITFSPANGTTRVPLNSNITINFSTAMTLFNGNAITNDNIWDFIILRQGSANGTRVDYTATINNARTAITITPRNNLANDTSFFLTIPRNALLDASGNGNEAQSISFSTGTVNAMVEFNPQEDSVVINRRQPITITFAEAIELTNGGALNDTNLRDAIVFRRGNVAANGTGGQAVPNADFNISISSNSRIITIDPTRDLALNETYYVGIADRVFRTRAGHNEIARDGVRWTIGQNTTITLEPTALNFSAPPNTQPVAQTITVRNTGSNPTSTLNVALSGPNANRFTLSETTLGVISSNGTRTFTVRPTTDQPTAGASFTATVTVSGSNVASRTVALNYSLTDAFVPVSHITLTSPITTPAGVPLLLSATVSPANATNQIITWNILDAGGTGATLIGSRLYTTTPGAVTIRATIANGVTTTTNFTTDFVVNATPIAASLTTTPMAASLPFIGTVDPKLELLPSRQPLQTVLSQAHHL